MTGTDQRPFTEADVDRYAQFIAGRPDAIVADWELAAARAVLDGLAQDGRLTRAIAGHDAPACDALCRDVEEDRDRLVAATVNWRDSHRGEGAHPADRDLIALADTVRDDAR
jgi:hypothetical protein